VKLNIVPARTGIQWVRQGIRTFFRQPLALAGLFFMFTMFVLLLGVVPLIGPVAAVILLPAATLGMMVATEETTKGKFPLPTVFVAAFRAGRQRARAMLVLGAMYAVVVLLITLVASLFGAGQPPVEVTQPQGGAQAQMELRPPFFVALLLQAPVMVLFTHAPALVHWHGVSPAKAIFFSAVAFWRNIGAFIVFAAAWVLVMSAVLISIATLFVLFGATPTPQAMLPVALIVPAMISTSMYFTFRDSFAETPDNEPPQPEPPGGEPPP
jgi:hypothetical protein